MTIALVNDNVRPPPHSDDLERAVLGAPLILGDAVRVDLDALTDGDLLNPVHRDILEAMRALWERGGTVDHETVAQELRTRGQFGRLEGGAAYLVGLGSKAPLANVAHHVRMLRALADRRRMIALGSEITSRAHGTDDLGEILAEARGRLDDIAAASATAHPRLIDLVDRLVNSGTPLPTDLHTLDKNCRGGFRRGRRVIIGGAPGAGKTTLALGWALAWALAGAVVAVVAADESAADLLVRIGQMLGLDRDALEAGDATTLAALRAELEEIPTLLVLDGDDGATVEDAVAAVRKIAGERMGAIVVDGVQTARAVGSDDADSPRARVDAVLASLRRASQLELVVVATSELARGAYRSKDAQDRIDDLAAGKESGGIEYVAQTLLVLRPVPDRNGEVDVSIPKNRGGGREPLRLLIDFQRARVQEIYRANEEAAPDPDARLKADMEMVRAELREDLVGVPGTDALLAKLRFGKERGRAAIRTLEARGEILVEKGPNNTRRLFLAPASPASPGSAQVSPGGALAQASPASPLPLGRAGLGAGLGAGSPDGQASPGGKS